jgi:hypothetical protein
VNDNTTSNISTLILRGIIARVTRAAEAVADDEPGLALQILEDLAYELERQAK